VSAVSGEVSAREHIESSESYSIGLAYHKLHTRSRSELLSQFEQRML
jgi:hypothetical protein